MRHDLVQTSVQCGAKAAGFASSIEPQERHLKNMQFGDKGYGMRGDVLVSTLDDVLNIDIVVTHPASKTMRARPCKEPGVAAKEAARIKKNKHASGDTQGHTFVPFAVESYGRLGLDAVQLLKDWADAVGKKGTYCRAVYMTWVKRELSVSLVKGNARLFKRFVGVLTRGIGQNFVEGMDVPVLE